MNQGVINDDLQSIDEDDFRSYQVCKHALSLLAPRRSAFHSGELHLDLGCAYGPFAKKVESSLGRRYVAFGGSGDGLTTLAMLGFETHEVSVEGEVSILAQLKEVVGERRIGSITVLDTIEWVGNCEQILRDVADLARAHSAFVVVSAPNVTHRDIGAKLAFGRWDYAQSGRAGRASARLFDQKSLAWVLEKSGLHTIERNDIVQSKSDQHFPPDHPALASGTPLRGLLVSCADLVDPNSRVAKFVWACAPALQVDREIFGIPPESKSRPFLTAVIRTRGRRNHTFVEVLNCLAAQSDSDFEVLVVGHRLEPSKAEAVQRVILDCGESLRSRIRMLQVDDGSRSKPLNFGFENARGRYISIVDDDDIILGNWVEEFRKLDAENRGRILRCVTIRQSVINVQTNGKPGLRACGSLELVFPSEFHFLEHLRENRSALCGLAFPRGAFHDLGIRFDESLNTMEDWDYTLRVAALCGVASSPVITNIYRWWVVGESSRTVHSQLEWQQDREAILRKQVQQYYILPKGELPRLRQMAAEVSSLREEVSTLREEAGALREEAGALREEAGALRAEARSRIQSQEARSRTPTLPSQFVNLTKRNLNKAIIIFKLKYHLYFYSKNRRRKYLHRIAEYRSFRDKL